MSKPKPDQSIPDDSLSAVLRNVRQGCDTAASELHEKFVARLVRLATSRINQRFRSKIEPEEVVQSVFATFFRRHQHGNFDFNDWNDLWALLVQITVRKCATKVDGFMTHKRDVARESTPSAPLGSVTVTDEPTAEEIAIYQETLDQLFDRLTEPMQEIVCLRLEGLSNLEISEKIGRSERTVYRLLNHVRDVFIAFE